MLLSSDGDAAPVDGAPMAACRCETCETLSGHRSDGASGTAHVDGSGARPGYELYALVTQLDYTLLAAFHRLLLALLARGAEHLVPYPAASGDAKATPVAR